MLRWIVILANVGVILALILTFSVLLILREEVIAFGTVVAIVALISIIYAIVQGKSDTLPGAWIEMKKAQYRKKTRELDEGSS